MNRLRTGQSLSPLDLSDRSDKVRSKISKSEAVVVMDPPNVQWMTGFTGSNGTVYIDHERFVLITDQRYQEQGPLEITQTRSTAELAISKPGVIVPLLTPGAISILYDDTGLPRANLYVLASIVNSCV